MKTRTFNLKSFVVVLSLASAVAARADSITVVSDASTLGVGLGAGAPSSAIVSQLDAGDVSGLIFQPALAGAYGTFTPVPPGAPAGTEVINIAPGDGESGFFEVFFTLPPSYAGISLNGVGNVDDGGLVFLNGHLLTPLAQPLTEFGDVSFSTTDASFFNAGVNALLIADDNSGGGPSGAAFYADVNYNAVPDSGAGLLPCFALLCLAMEFYRRRTLIRS